MSVERLTPEERKYLEYRAAGTAVGCLASRSALAIIDASESDRAALVEQAAHYKRESETLKAELNDSHRVYDIALKSAEDAIAALRGRVDSLERDNLRLRGILATEDTEEFDLCAFHAGGGEGRPSTCTCEVGE